MKTNDRITNLLNVNQAAANLKIKFPTVRAWIIVTPKLHKRLNETEARARISALHRDPAFFQRFLADEAGAGNQTPTTRH